MSGPILTKTCRHEPFLRGGVAGVQAATSEGLLGLLSSGWQIVIAVCLVIVTAIGLARLVGRGLPA